MHNDETTNTEICTSHRGSVDASHVTGLIDALGLLLI